MSFLALIIALVWLHYYPPPFKQWLARQRVHFFDLIIHYCNAGQRQHGIIIWLLAVAIPALLLGLLCYAAAQIGAITLLLVNVLGLYVGLGFSHFGKAPLAIAEALKQNQLDGANQLLQNWRDEIENNPAEMNTCEVASVSNNSIVKLLLDFHQGLLAPILWWLIAALFGCGLVGLALYALSQQLARMQNEPQAPSVIAIQRIFNRMDWLPAHISALGFAIAGDFEDAIYAWRSLVPVIEATALSSNSQLLLASGAGAIEVKLQLSATQTVGMGDTPDADYIKAALGLVWRTLLLLIGVMALLTFAHYLGR